MRSGLVEALARALDIALCLAELLDLSTLDEEIGVLSAARRIEVLASRGSLVLAVAGHWLEFAPSMVYYMYPSLSVDDRDLMLRLSYLALVLSDDPRLRSVLIDIGKRLDDAEIEDLRELLWRISLLAHMIEETPEPSDEPSERALLDAERLIRDQALPRYPRLRNISDSLEALAELPKPVAFGSFLAVKAGVGMYGAFPHHAMVVIQNNYREKTTVCRIAVFGGPTLSDSEDLTNLEAVEPLDPALRRLLRVSRRALRTAKRFLSMMMLRRVAEG